MELDTKTATFTVSIREKKQHWISLSHFIQKSFSRSLKIFSFKAEATTACNCWTRIETAYRCTGVERCTGNGGYSHPAMTHHGDNSLSLDLHKWSNSWEWCGMSEVWLHGKEENPFKLGRTSSLNIEPHLQVENVPNEW